MLNQFSSLKKICDNINIKSPQRRRERGGKVFLICGETAANQKGSSLREISTLLEMWFLKEGALIQSASPDWIKSKFPLRSPRLVYFCQVFFMSILLGAGNHLRVAPCPILVIRESLLSSNLASLGLRCKRGVIQALREGRRGRLKYRE